MTQSAQSDAPQKAGVLLVHGIGDIRAGAVNEALVQALEQRGDAGLSFPEVAEMRRLEETPSSPSAGEVGDYPYPLRRASAPDGREAVFAELFWSDVKSIDARKAQPLFLFLGSLLQAHRVIGGLLSGRGDPIAMALRPLLLAGAFLLRGPIVGLNLTLLLTLLAIKYCAIAQQALDFQMEGFYFVVGGLLFSTATGAVLISRRLLATRVFVEIGWCVIVIALLGLAVAGTIVAETGVAGFNEFAFFAKSWLAVAAAWLLMTAIVLLATVLLTLDLVTLFRKGARRTRRSGLLAVGVLLFQILLWSTVMRVFWLTIDGDLQQTIDFGRLDFLSGADVVKTLQFSVLLNIVSLAAVFAVVVLVALIRAALSRGLPVWALARGRVTPRLIVSPAALLVTLLLGVAGLLATIAVALGHGDTALALKAAIPGLGDSIYAMLYDDILPWLDQNALEFAASTLVVASPAALFVFRGVLTQGSFLLQDIIDYQPDGPSARRVGMGEGAAEPMEGAPSLARGRICRRLHQVVADLVVRERIDLLVIAAHSQGSVIVFDLLPDVVRTCDLHGVPVKVITMGSPLRHIYEHYFEEYATLGPRLDAFGATVLSWRNFYRVDDAIGQRLSVFASCFVEENALPRGGHTSYWRERPIGDAVLTAIASKQAQPTSSR